jgi:hypothetical protein
MFFLFFKTCEAFGLVGMGFRLPIADLHMLIAPNFTQQFILRRSKT